MKSMWIKKKLRNTALYWCRKLYKKKRNPKEILRAYQLPHYSLSREVCFVLQGIEKKNGRLSKKLTTGLLVSVIAKVATGRVVAGLATNPVYKSRLTVT